VTQIHEIQGKRQTKSNQEFDQNRSDIKNASNCFGSGNQRKLIRKFLSIQFLIVIAHRLVDALELKVILRLSTTQHHHHCVVR
jgi:hypothetical protein